MKNMNRREFLGTVGAVGSAVALAGCASDGKSARLAGAGASTSASASTLARAIRAKDISSQELVEAHLRRIAEVNPKLNAIVQLTADSARAEARAADAALARGEIRGPMHGVPFTVKDTLET